MTDRELSGLLDRTLEAVRSRRQDLLGCRWTSPLKRWEGKSGIVFENDLVRDYLEGASQSFLAKKFHIELSKLRQVLLSHGVLIRGKSQQMFIDRFGRSPTIRLGLSRSKLYYFRNVRRWASTHEPDGTKNSHNRNRRGKGSRFRGELDL